MKNTDFYERYFEADMTYNGVKRRAADVKLTVETDSGMIKYTVSVNFFPHSEDDDFAISYDAYFQAELYAGKGRRSKKKEAVFLDGLREKADETAKKAGGVIYWDITAKKAGGVIYWDKPLTDERKG